jgi:hypothetical protein
MVGTAQGLPLPTLTESISNSAVRRRNFAIAPHILREVWPDRSALE